MEVAWIAAIAVLWLAMAGMVFGLFALDLPKGDRT